MKPGPATSADATSGSSASAPAIKSASARGLRLGFLGQHHRRVRREIAVGGVARRLDHHLRRVETGGQRALASETVDDRSKTALEIVENVH